MTPKEKVGEEIMNEQMKPCPFCGDKPQLETEGNDFTKKRQAKIVCDGCGAKIVVGAVHKTAEWCIDTVTRKWNCRIAVKEVEP